MRAWVAVLASALVLCSCDAGGSRKAIRGLAGSRVRVAWVRDTGDGADLFATGQRCRLMGFDSDDGKGERTILAAPSNYSRPLITPQGDRVVFSNRGERKIYIVNWDGSGLAPLSDGFAVDTWRDPADGSEWVCCFSDPVAVDRQDRKAYSGVERFKIADPSQRLKVWDVRAITQLAENNFQFSADGRRASVHDPEGCGVADTGNQQWIRFGKGCWPSIAPDNSYRFWHFEGKHRNLRMYGPDGAERAEVPINGAPGVEGREVFHPRWSNHPRFMTMTGPLGAPKGGAAWEIYIGRFNADFTGIEDWARVTRNEAPDLLPDVWVESGASLAADPGSANVAGAGRGGEVPAKAGGKRVEISIVEARMVESSAIPEPRAIAPYRRALVANRYEIVSVLQGECPHREIMAAHWAIRDARVLDTARRRKGEVYRMTIVPYEARPDLEGERLLIDGDPLLLPLYHDTGG